MKKKKFKRVLKLESGNFIRHIDLRLAKFAMKHMFHPIKSDILIIISANREFGVPVEYIVGKLNEEQSVISQHLKPLRDMGIVYYKQHGKQHIYFFNEEGFQAIEDLRSSIGYHFFKDFDSVTYQDVFNFLNVLSHDFRLQILDLLIKAGPQVSGTIYRTLNAEQSWSSQNAGELIKLGFIKTLRQGKNIMNTADQKKLDLVAKFVGRYFLNVQTAKAKCLVQTVTA